jgi:hypothetical protein
MPIVEAMNKHERWTFPPYKVWTSVSAQVEFGLISFSLKSVEGFL